jgi:osmotically-inducible protein OsmY
MKIQSTVLAALLASASMLAGCDRPGPRADNEAERVVVAASERSNTPAGEMREEGRELRESAGNASETMVDRTRDAAITAQVNARLAGDRDLSALGINVDTAAGRVVLHGSAPDTAARERATTLARSVDGVVSVDNELRVEPPK